MNVREYTAEFKEDLQNSDYSYSDEFLYSMIKTLEERVRYLEQKLESDHK